MLALHDITGLVLAGGRGSRMGGVDKGLQPFRGQPLALRALQRLRPQVGVLAVNANRSLQDYQAFGVPVWSDARPDFAGPLAGLLAGLAHCATPWLVTVPCDTPLFPTDLVARLAAALVREQAELAMAVAPDDDGTPRPQPVFSLLRTDAAAGLRDGLEHFVGQGGRRVAEWARGHRTAYVPFDTPADSRQAFANANTLDELAALEALPPDAAQQEAATR